MVLLKYSVKSDEFNPKLTPGQALGLRPGWAKTKVAASPEYSFQDPCEVISEKRDFLSQNFPFISSFRQDPIFS